MSDRREVGPRSREIVAREQHHIAPGYQGLAQYAGLAMARGSGCTLVDEDDHEYIDFMAGIGVGSVGHWSKNPSMINTNPTYWGWRTCA